MCTPIGSRFSIEQTTTALPRASHITSSSCSCQPARYSSTSTWPTGLAAMPFAIAARSSLGRVRDAAAAAAERERRPHDRRHREVDVGRGRDDRVRHRDADARHRLAEELAILGAVDRLEVGADQLDPFSAANERELDGEVQRRLPAERRQDRVGLLALDDLRDRVGVERLEVGRVGPLGVGHDRRRVRVHEHDAVALAPQHAAGLRPRVVELARLPDADRAGAQDQDRAKVGSFRHAVGEPVEEGQGVERPGRGLGVELHAGEAVAGEALAGAVVQRDVRDVAVRDHREAVVLDGDEHAAGRDVAHRVVRAAMAERQLEGLVAEREAEQLVAEADAEERDAAEQLRGSSRSARRTSPGRRGRCRSAPRAARPRGSRPRPTRPGRRTPRRPSPRAGAGSSSSRRGRRRRRAAPRRREYGSFVHGSRGSGLPSMNGSASARSRSSSTGASPSAQRSTPPSRILRTSVRVSTAVSATTPCSRSQRANSGRASRITTPSHCTRSDSIRASSTPYVPISGYEKHSTCAT